MLVGALAPCFHERHPIRAEGAGVAIDTTWLFAVFLSGDVVLWDRSCEYVEFLQRDSVYQRD